MSRASAQGLWGLGGKGRTSGRDPEEMELRRPTPAHPEPPWARRGRPQGPPGFLFRAGCRAPRPSRAGSSLGSDRKRPAGERGRPAQSDPTGQHGAPDIPAPPPSFMKLSPRNALQTCTPSGSGPKQAPGSPCPQRPPCTPSVPLQRLARGPQLLQPVLPRPPLWPGPVAVHLRRRAGMCAAVLTFPQTPRQPPSVLPGRL